MGKRTLALTLFATVLLPCVGESQPNSGRELPLAEAVRLSLRQNPDLRVESLNSAISEEDVVRSRAIYDPILTTSVFGQGSQRKAGSGVEKTGTASVAVSQLLPTGGTLSIQTQTGFVNLFPPIGGPAYDFSSGVTAFLTQPLQRNVGKEVTESSITLARFAHRDALERFRATAIDTLLTVVTSYNRLYNLRQARDARKRSHELALQLVQDTRDKLNQGTLQPVDLANAEYGAAQRLKDVVDAERNVRDQEANLRYLIGLGEPGEIVPLDPPTRQEPEATQEEAIKIALENRSDLKQLRSALEASRLQERISQNQTLPDVALVASGGVLGAGGTLPDNLQQMGNGRSWWSAGIQLTAPLGNRAADSDFRKAKLRTAQVRTQIDALSLRIRNDVETDLRALISARLQIRLSDTALEQAQQRLEEYRRNREAGTATTQDVLLAETDLSNAVTSRLDAIEAYAGAVLKLWRDTGELPERLGIQVELTKPSEKPGASLWEPTPRDPADGVPEGAGDVLAAARPLGPEDFQRVVRRLSRAFPSPRSAASTEVLPATPPAADVLQGLSLLRPADPGSDAPPLHVSSETVASRDGLRSSKARAAPAPAGLVRRSPGAPRSQAGLAFSGTRRVARVTGAARGRSGRLRTASLGPGERSRRAPPASPSPAARAAPASLSLLPARCHPTIFSAGSPVPRGPRRLVAHLRQPVRSWSSSVRSLLLSSVPDRPSRRLSSTL